METLKGNAVRMPVRVHPEFEQTKIGRRLKVLRVAMDLQATDIAERMGITPGAYSQWENGVQIPSRESISWYVANFPDTSIDYVYINEPRGLSDRLRPTVAKYQKLSDNALNELDKKHQRRPPE